MSEPQYRELVETTKRIGPVELGYHSSWTWRNDHKRLGFVLARYKFAAKMLHGMERVLEIGCADGFYSRVVADEVSAVQAVDFDPEFIANAKANTAPDEMLFFRQHDMVKDGPVEGLFDAFYTID